MLPSIMSQLLVLDYWDSSEKTLFDKTCWSRLNSEFKL